MSCFLEFLRCFLCCVEEDYYEDRDLYRYEAIAQPQPRRYSHYSPPRFQERPTQASSSSSSSSSSHSAYFVYTKSNYSTQTSSASAPAIEPRPKRPETKPIRFAETPTCCSCTSSVSDRPQKTSTSFSSDPTRASSVSTLDFSDLPKRKPSLVVSDLAKRASQVRSKLKKKLVDCNDDLVRTSIITSGRASGATTSTSSDVVVVVAARESGYSGGPNPPRKDPTRKASGLGPPLVKLPLYTVPDHIKKVIEREEVPQVLTKPLSPSTYGDYFAALLYAEDYYIEKWDVFLKEFKLSEVTLKLQEETTSTTSWKNRKTIYMDQRDKLGGSKEKRVYVEIEIDLVPERRPFLLSRDYVYLRRSGKNVNPFQGFCSKVVRSRYIWAEFGEDFHSQHSPNNKYDVTFSFNRVCLKRSHQAVAAAVDPSFENTLFPKGSRNKHPFPFNEFLPDKAVDAKEFLAIYQILTLKGPQPYLLVGELNRRVSGVLNQAILQIYRLLPDSRVLIVAPRNDVCDLLMRDLMKEIPESDMFRANAAFRERDEVPDDIFSSSLYEKECFTCPPVQELRRVRVITSTFISSFRLYCHGINAGHFTHIFVVDACNITEPETMVTLANLANESTAVVLTGESERYAGYIRSDIAREKGLRISFFRRLLNSEIYLSRNPAFVSYL